MNNIFKTLVILLVGTSVLNAQCVNDDADPTLQGASFTESCIMGFSTLNVTWSMNAGDFMTTAPAGSWGIDIQFPNNGNITPDLADNVWEPSSFNWIFEASSNRLRGVSNVDMMFDDLGTVKIAVRGNSIVSCPSAGINASVTVYGFFGPPTGAMPCPAAFSNNTSNDVQTASYGVQSTSLPVKMAFFRGKSIECREVELNWATHSEFNNAGFEVERSIEGNSFEKVGFVKAKELLGRSENNYNFTDQIDDNLNNKSVYYRLKQVDTDGEFEYSELIKVVPRCTVERTLAISPNPAINLINLDVTGITSDVVDVQILNVNGQLVYDNELDVSDLISFDISKFESGIYTLRLDDGGHILKESFIKIR